MFSPVSAEIPRPIQRNSGPYGGGRVAPHGGHRQGEDVVEAEPGGGPDPVRVEPCSEISLCARYE